MQTGITTTGKFSIGDEPKFDPVSKSIPDMLTIRQNGLIFAAARNAAVDAHRECERIFECGIHELSKLGASKLIEHLQNLPQASGSKKPKQNATQLTPQIDLFSLQRSSAGAEKGIEPGASDFEPFSKRAGFADRDNPLTILAAEIVGNCGVRQTYARTYRVSHLRQNGVEEFSVIVRRVGGAKCECPDFIKKSPLAVGGKFKCEHIIAAMMFYREICEAMRN